MRKPHIPLIQFFSLSLTPLFAPSLYKTEMWFFIAQFNCLLQNIYLILLIFILLPFTGFSIPSIPRDKYPGIKLHLVEMSNSFDDDFLQRGLRNQLPGITPNAILDLAQWFYAKSNPCCERLLDQLGLRPIYNCNSLPQPTDHKSTIFLYRLIFECIGEGKNNKECCLAKGVKSERCLKLCDASNPSIDLNSLENNDGNIALMDSCAAEIKMPKERFLWLIFECINPNFSKVLQITQEVKNGEMQES